MKEIVSPEMFGERKKRITDSEIKLSEEQKCLVRLTQRIFVAMY